MCAEHATGDTARRRDKPSRRAAGAQTARQKLRDTVAPTRKGRDPNMKYKLAGAGGERRNGAHLVPVIGHPVMLECDGTPVRERAEPAAEVTQRLHSAARHVDDERAAK